MDKYVIRNCPACYLCSNKYVFDENNDKYCKDITDCVMKQIVELCKEELKGQYSDTWSLVQKISKLLNIQEVE